MPLHHISNLAEEHVHNSVREQVVLMKHWSSCVLRHTISKMFIMNKDFVHALCACHDVLGVVENCHWIYTYLWISKWRELHVMRILYVGGVLYVYGGNERCSA